MSHTTRVSRGHGPMPAIVEPDYPDGPLGWFLAWRDQKKGIMY